MTYVFHRSRKAGWLSLVSLNLTRTIRVDANEDTVVVTEMVETKLGTSTKHDETKLGNDDGGSKEVTKHDETKLGNDDGGSKEVPETS